MSAEIALVNRGVGLDVVGIGYDAVTDEQRAAVVAAHPRPDFKNGILAAFTEGIKDRPETTFGNIKADVLEHFVPGFVRGTLSSGSRRRPGGMRGGAAWALLRGAGRPPGCGVAGDVAIG